jgi:hypothetical protein
MLNKLILWTSWGFGGLSLLLATIAAIKGADNAAECLGSALGFAIMGGLKLLIAE